MREILGYGILGTMGLGALYVFVQAWHESEGARFVIFVLGGMAVFLALLMLGLWLIGVPFN